MFAFQRGVEKRFLIIYHLTEASLLKFVWHLHQSLEQWESEAIESILQASSVHVDETSFRDERKNYWIHVYSSGGTTLKLLHRKRGKEAIVGLTRYGGVIIHDCWTSYLSYDHCSHGLCGSHLLRELFFVFDSNGDRWARNMKKLLQENCRRVAESKEKCLTDKEYANLQKRYQIIAGNTFNAKRETGQDGVVVLFISP